MTLDVTFTSTPSYMGHTVGDDDGTSRTPHISLPALPALPCPIVPRPVLSVFLEFNVEEIMYKLLSLSSEP